MAYKKDQVVFGDNAEIPSGVYAVRITKMEKTRSSSGNEMVTTQVEIISPESVSVAGKNVMIAGRKHTIYNVLNPAEAWGLGRLITGLCKAGLDPVEVQGLPEDIAFDEDNLQPFNGKCFYIALSSEPKKMFKTLTPEEKAQGKKPEALKDPEGKEVTNGFNIVGDWTKVVGPYDGEQQPY